MNAGDGDRRGDEPAESAALGLGRDRDGIGGHQIGGVVRGAEGNVSRRERAETEGRYGELEGLDRRLSSRSVKRQKPTGSKPKTVDLSGFPSRSRRMLNNRYPARPD
ncbi:hypothetical protein AWC22_14650 [Mycobacterium riyadhense]|uniref:Uncharacterized protein n=1 Tax=Mycobacterium riyadhense TaxID=486698 RepID=A0A1X2D724_9MYCO|nr:hypothetical protein AWC22_14650 [Mycobacterium riyadhense]